MHYLLLRGWVRDQRHWAGFDKQLQSLAPNSQVVCLDNPGVGTESKRSSPLSTKQIVEDLRSRWSKASGEWTVLGISFGGMLAMEWARLYPQDFDRMVLINSTAADVSPVLQRLKIDNLPQLFRIALEKDPVRREFQILEMTSRSKPSELPYEISKVGWKVAMSQLLAALGFRLGASLPRLPTLVLCSINDKLVDSRACQGLAKLLQADLRLHNTAGHDLPLDDPKWCAEQIQNWVENEKFSGAREN